jgi:hypothetical protein
MTGGTAVGQAFEAGPEGQTFLVPVELVLPFDPTRLSPGSVLDAIQVRMAPHGMSNFGALQSSVNLSTGFVQANTTHFTQFVPAQSAATIFITTPPSLPSATTGVAYSQQFTASGGTLPYTFSAPSSTALPPGLSLGGSGLLSGTPTVPNNFAFFIEVSDSAGDAVELAVSLTVNPPSNPVPVLTQVAPGSASQGGGDTLITLSGTGFAPTVQALWDGSPLPTTFVGPTKVAATIPAIDLLNANTHQVSVSNPPPGGGTSGSIAFTVTPASLNPVPTLVAVSPTKLPISSVDVQVSITGSNFVTASSAVIGSQGISTSYTSSTQLLAAVPAAYLSSAGTLPLGVFNPAPGGGFSPTTVSIAVGTLNPTPTLTTLEPSSVSAGSGAFTLDLSGTSFVDGVQAFFGSTALSTTFIGSTSAQAAVPAYLVATAGSAQVVLVNPAPGGGASAGAAFSIGAGEAGDGGNSGWAWRQVGETGTGPAARLGGGMATLGSNIVLFGGSANGIDSGPAFDYGDTWTWDGASWTQLSPLNSPSPRSPMATGAFGDNVVLFGGTTVNPLTLLEDTWVWDGSDWTNVPTTHTPPVVETMEGAGDIIFGYAMAALGTQLVMFGGYPNETWTWDGTDWTLESPANSPSNLGSVEMTTVGTSVVLFGNEDVGASPNQIWTWNGSNWTLLTSSANPTPRAWPGLATLGTNVFLFGGTILGSPLNSLGDDTWMWNGVTWAQVTTSQSPSARTNSLMAPLGDALYLFGGGFGGTYYADTWAFGPENSDAGP